MEKVKREIRPIEGSYSIYLAFTQDLSLGINAMELPESSLYSNSLPSYNFKIAYNNAITKEQNASVADYIEAIASPIQGTREIVPYTDPVISIAGNAFREEGRFAGNEQ